MGLFCYLVVKENKQPLTFYYSILKNKGLLLLLAILLGCGKQSKERNVLVHPESMVVDNFINIARDSTLLSLTERKQYLERALVAANTFSNDTIRLDHLSRISLAYKRLEDSLGFRKMNRKVLEVSEKNKIYKVLGESHWDLASFLKSYGIMDSAYFHYKRAYKSFDLMPIDSTSLSLRGRILYNMGRIQDYFKDYLGAEVNVTEAIRIFEDLGDYKRIYNCNNLLGITAQGMNNSAKSVEYFNKAGSFIDKLQVPNKTTYIRENQNNIAGEFLRNEQYKKAIEGYNELLTNKNLRSEDPRLYALASISQGYAIFKGEKDYENSKTLLTKGIRINDSIGFSINQSMAKQYLAELLIAQGDTVNAKKTAKESLSLAKETSNNYRHLEVLRVLTTLDSENAVSYSKEYYDLSEKINNEENAIRDKFARIRLETDEVIQRAELLSRQKQIWIGVTLGLILLGIALFVIVAQRISNNRLKFQQKQQESNQEIYNLMLSQQGKFEEGKQLEKKRISEELHDGILGQMLGIRLILSGLNDKEDEASIQQRAELIEKLRELEEEIRTISHELSDASYQKFYNFIVSLEDLIDTIGKSAGITCSFTYDDQVDWDDLEGDIKINAYRIVQESLQNCVKHAQCKNVNISFMRDGDRLKLVVADDGVGFDINKGKRGIGLRNVISRVKKVEGTLHIDSTIGKGTTLSVTLPNTYIKLDDPKTLAERKQMLNV